jgi:hypothetical protein
MLRKLVIDGTTRARVAEVEEFAFANWYRPGQSESAPGDDPRHVVKLDTYRCVFSYTAGPQGGLYRHLSVSVPSKHLPHPFAVFTIAELFGFTGWNGKTQTPPEDWAFGIHKKDHCVILAQKMPDAKKNR